MFLRIDSEHDADSVWDQSVPVRMEYTASWLQILDADAADVTIIRRYIFSAVYDDRTGYPFSKPMAHKASQAPCFLAMSSFSMDKRAARLSNE